MQRENNNAIISVHDLSVRFYLGAGVVNAVEHLSFNVRKGVSFGIVGESGSGKTVTALTIMGLLARPPGRVDSGAISYNGIDLLKLKDEEMRRIRGKSIAMVYQDPMTSLNPVLRVGFQIAETLMVHEKIPRHHAEVKAIELMESMGIPEAEKRAKEYPHQFSGGMRQRIMIAMALATNPDLLIADEPTTALDVITQSQILALLRELERKRNMTVILITHDLGIVAQVCEEVLVMYAGHGMERGSIREIFSNPKHPYTRGLLESTTRADRDIDRLRSIPGTIPDLINPPTGCRFQPRCPVAQVRCSTQEPPPFSDNADGYSKCWQSEHS
ncbi:MAG TPA: ABC transporter ATP-binding protein [Terriglobales bacterium]|nr:ABC transporter ATP-binding protein [Terriglobales bacterium]